MASAYAFKRYTAFVYLTSSMAWQLVYSFICCCLDIYALRTKLDLHNPVFVWPMVITDWITGILSLAAAASSASVAIFLARDTEFCKANPHIPCDQYSLAAILALMAWSFMAASAASTTRLLASFFE
ncbi:hypothetical protein PR202_ga10184 [Eleusine coracana subsp. coracana]|uniref:CASP-like protein n=1 Tax=Eleusine coracana subsp. coracana TaxID=191504 RepID=A0AAV5C624_ELECO|nr:hypothetical protein PR202_ga10184 [Eleusine coracana subsp. coracana]